jgi:hypothetical protein
MAPVAPSAPPARRMVTLALAAAMCLVALAPAQGEAAKLRRPGSARVVDALVKRIEVRWNEKSRGESRYELGWRQGGAGRWRRKRLGPGTEGFAATGLKRGRPYSFRVRACRASRCSRWSHTARQTTLLARPLDPYPGLGGCSIFPEGPAQANLPSLPDQRAWNQDVSSSPVHPNSDAIIDQITSSGNANLHPDFGSFTGYGIPYVVVPGAQTRVPITFANEGAAYGDESDPGPYPVPIRAPVEGLGAEGDEHVLVVDRGDCVLYELFNGDYRGGLRNRWAASGGSRWDLTSAALRPEGWTSADAAGLPIFAGLVRYDEVASGEIDHAIRVTFDQTLGGYLHPATHYASSSCDTDRPAMGMRLRLKQSYDISGIGGHAHVIAIALKRYGFLVADNGSDWFFTGASDSRWDDDDLNQLKDIPGSAFEVVQSEDTIHTPCP